MIPAVATIDRAQRRSAARSRSGDILVAGTIGLVAWGALSFGAVYPWGYWPLIIGCALIGSLELAFIRPASTEWWRLPTALAAVAMVVALQLVPIAAPRLAAWSPARDAFLRQQDVLYALSGGAASHALSIDPHATRIALACLVAFGLFLAGTTRLLSVAGPGSFVRGLAAFGLLLALFAIVQNMAFAGRSGEGHVLYIYGFWPDPYVNKPFGPFINKNNFAGWMIMAMPLVLGYAIATASRSWRDVAPDWRNRVLWLSSQRAARTIFASVAAFGMGIALVMSMSRSGMVAAGVVIVTAAWWAPGRSPRRRHRLVPVAVSLVLLASLSLWVGTDAIAQRFSDGTEATMRGRFGAWKDATTIVRDFPILGVGANAFSTAMLHYQRHDQLNFWEEAHNDYLQIAAEGGAVLSVFALVAMAIAAAGVRARVREEANASTAWLRLGAVTSLAAIALQEMVEFSLQIPGNAVLFAAVLAVALHHAPPRRG